MKKLLKPTNLPCIILAAGAIGLLLRIWLLGTGTDERGFLVSGHPAEVLLWVLSAAVIALLLYCTRRLLEAPKYQFNFPQSLAAAIGCMLGALGIAITSLSEMLLHADTLTVIAAILGLLSAGALVFMGHCRYKGLRSNVLCHATVSLYLMIRLISQYRHWSSDPQLQDYCFQLLATVCLMLAAYHRATFDANIGKRRPHAIFHLAAVYFCCLSLAGSDNIAFYLGTGAWMMTDLCSLIPLPEQKWEDA